MKKAFFPIIFLFIYSVSVAGQNNSLLQWEVVNPFPFFTNREHIDELRRIYAGLGLDAKEITPGKLERAMQDAADRDTDMVRANAGKIYDCSDPKDLEQRKKCFAQYLGWFAKVAGNSSEDPNKPEKISEWYRDTCWDYVKRAYRRDNECANYIDPGPTVRVRAWIDGFENGGVQFAKNGNPIAGTCDPKYGRNNCVEFDMEYTGNDTKAAASEISASRDGAVIAAAPVSVNNRLIVGLGDSYAAGEGNPDRPASFTAGRTDVDFLYGMRVRRNPQRDKNGGAVWLDRRCHRSMYSYQFKTALHYALTYPHEVVTFVSFSCTGGVTDDIIKNEQSAREGGPRLQPQLSELLKTLRGGKNNENAKTLRTIDYLLLSTGGNDVKFARFASYVVNTGWVKALYAKKPRKDKTREYVRRTLLGDKENAGNYRRLQNALLDPNFGLNIQGCSSGKPCKRILITGYPNPFFEEPDRLCTARKEEFDVPFRNDEGRAERIVRIKDYMFDALREVQEDGPIWKELGWTVVKDHYADYMKHGFCAQGESTGGSGTAEKFIMPRRVRGQWEQFEPWNYRVYEGRRRWYKLAVDSKLTSDQSTYFRAISANIDLLFEDDIASIMHPTAEGLSRTAEANMKEINGLHE